MGQKIAFVIATYSSTGVPLAQIRLAKALFRRGFKIDFLIGHVPDSLPLPEIEGVRVINMKRSRTFKMLLPAMSYIRRNQPDVIFTAEDHLNAIVTLAVMLTGSRAKLSASSRITPYRVYSGRKN